MDFAEERLAMVRAQLIPRGIADERVLDAMKRVPRHEFIPRDMADQAHDDCPLPIGNAQTISQPYIVALMTECLKLKGDEKVLEIGTGSGYQLAILAELALDAYSVERIASLAGKAEETLTRLGYKNFHIKVGDGTTGWEEHQPYDGIVVTAGAPVIPRSLARQLKDGGRMVIPVGGGFGQVLTVIKRQGDSFLQEEVCGCSFVPLIGKEGWPERRSVF